MVLWPDLAGQILFRVLVTAAIVVLVTLSVERLTPKIGGALAGLPIVTGPALYFLLDEKSVVFGASAAAASLMSLTAAQVFLVGYTVVAARTKWAAIIVAVLSWICGIWALSHLQPSPWVGLPLFLVSMVAARYITECYVITLDRTATDGTLLMLIVRATIAGLLVAMGTIASGWLGPVWAGSLIAYPISLTVILVTVHHRSGAQLAILTARAAMLGIFSLAVFTFMVAILLEIYGPVISFVVALLASMSVTTSLVYRPSKKQGSGY